MNKTTRSATYVVTAAVTALAALSLVPRHDAPAAPAETIPAIATTTTADTTVATIETAPPETVVVTTVPAPAPTPTLPPTTLPPTTTTLPDEIVAEQGDHNQVVQQVQEALTFLGYLNDTIDGRWGPKTQTAWVAFEAQNFPRTSDGVLNVSELEYVQGLSAAWYEEQHTTAPAPTTTVSCTITVSCDFNGTIPPPDTTAPVTTVPDTTTPPAPTCPFTASSAYIIYGTGTSDGGAKLHLDARSSGFTVGGTVYTTGQLVPASVYPGCTHWVQTAQDGIGFPAAQGRYVPVA